LFADARPAPDFMGITVDRARARAAAKGITSLRVVDVDPEGSSGVTLTMDLRTDRLNVWSRAASSCEPGTSDSSGTIGCSRPAAAAAVQEVDQLLRSIAADQGRQRPG
jgi:hypothetical protein